MTHGSAAQQQILGTILRTARERTTPKAIGQGIALLEWLGALDATVALIRAKREAFEHHPMARFVPQVLDHVLGPSVSAAQQALRDRLRRRIMNPFSSHFS